MKFSYNLPSFLFLLSVGLCGVFVEAYQPHQPHSSGPRAPLCFQSPSSKGKVKETSAFLYRKKESSSPIRLAYKKSNNLDDSADSKSLSLKSKEDGTDGSSITGVSGGSGGVTDVTDVRGGFSYGEFAKQNPFLNNVMIATLKTAAADLLAQVVIGGTPITEIDLQRSLLFCAFGAIYLGGFQYLYQVQIFKKLFDVDKFTTQPWADKLQDTEGLKSLALQTVLDLTVLTIIYLPTFYIFKASIFSGSTDPTVWASTGIENYTNNFAKDEVDLIKVWLPADLVCFSVPLYLRLPVRHIVSFVWTAYLSFARGGH